MARAKINPDIPRAKDLIHPTVEALKNLGGSGTNAEILEEIIRINKVPDEVADISHLGSTRMTELSYQAAWARTYLKQYGIIENSAHAVWSITAEYSRKDIPEAKAIIAYSQTRSKGGTRQVTQEPDDHEQHDEERGYPEGVRPWEERLEEILHSMDPFGFERLAQRILRECGFSHVEVTKKTGDGGIDGTGKLKINGIFSFNIAFQCKRYRDQVGPAEIRNFRGSLTTDIEKGVFITTGRFSKAAREEASKPGKQQIDLIDGDELIAKIAEFGIGVKEVKTYEIDEEFFDSI
ncbi:MAG: restriction endonuclease [Spirochaetota bacterium]|jgi:restriction system protein|nr:restriction endonuclease [Spirochaetota bacterium]